MYQNVATLEVELLRLFCLESFRFLEEGCVAIELPPVRGAFRHFLSASGVAVEPISPLQVFLIFRLLDR